jgi:predicted transcriptional regulator
MRRRFVAVDDRLSAVDAARRVGESADDYAPVVDSAGKPVAVVTTESIRRAATGRRSLRGVLRRRTKRLITATVDEPLADVLERSHAHVVPVAVIENDRIIGIVDPRDIEERLRAASPDSVGDAADLDAWPGRRAATTP